MTATFEHDAHANYCAEGIMRDLARGELILSPTGKPEPPQELLKNQKRFRVRIEIEEA